MTICVPLAYIFVVVLMVLIFVFSALANRLTGKSISEMTILCQVGYKTLTQWKRMRWHLVNLLSESVGICSFCCMAWDVSVFLDTC